jgi:hypothetical protein
MCSYSMLLRQHCTYRKDFSPGGGEQSSLGSCSTAVRFYRVASESGGNGYSETKCIAAAFHDW